MLVALNCTKWSRRQHADHVHDLGFDGKDEFKNLWPLSGRKNLDTARFLWRQEVIYQKDEKKRRTSPRRLEMVNKWFIIVEVNTI